MKLSIYPDGRVILTLPYRVSQDTGRAYVEEKREWIHAQINQYRAQHAGKRIFTRSDYLAHKEHARRIITARVMHFNQFYQFAYNKIAIKDMRTMWGSCSAKRNLNFNYKLLFLTPEQRDYVIVHELCHLKELNHSKRFWDLVRQCVPDLSRIRSELRKTESTVV